MVKVQRVFVSLAAASAIFAALTGCAGQGTSSDVKAALEQMPHEMAQGLESLTVTDMERLEGALGSPPTVSTLTSESRTVDPGNFHPKVTYEIFGDLPARSTVIITGTTQAKSLAVLVGDIDGKAFEGNDWLRNSSTEFQSPPFFSIRELGSLSSSPLSGQSHNFQATLFNGGAILQRSESEDPETDKRANQPHIIKVLDRIFRMGAYDAGVTQISPDGDDSSYFAMATGIGLSEDVPRFYAVLPDEQDLWHDFSDPTEFLTDVADEVNEYLDMSGEYTVDRSGGYWTLEMAVDTTGDSLYRSHGKFRSALIEFALNAVR